MVYGNIYRIYHWYYNVEINIMKNKTDKLTKGFEKLMTDMGATFVDVTPEKKQTEHIADIVKKVDWDQRIKEIWIQDNPIFIDYEIFKKRIKQLLFEYGESLIKEKLFLESLESWVEKTYKGERIYPEELRERMNFIYTVRARQGQKNKEVLK